MGPPGSCLPQVGLMLSPWTLLSGKIMGRQVFFAKPLPKTILVYFGTNFGKILMKIQKHIISRMHCKVLHETYWIFYAGINLFNLHQNKIIFSHHNASLSPMAHVWQQGNVYHATKAYFNCIHISNYKNLFYSTMHLSKASLLTLKSFINLNNIGFILALPKPFHCKLACIQLR